MDSKSHKIDYNFKRRVLEHLKGHGFNCIVQPKSLFPDILAWRPFSNSAGEFMALNVQENLAGKIKQKILLPFYVSFIECNTSKHIGKKKREAAKLLLEEGRCNAFLIAHKKDKKLLFHEIILDEKEIIITKPLDKITPSYIQ